MLCYRLTHPRYQIPRTYHVRVRGAMNDKKLKGLQRLAGSPSGSKRPTVELVKHADHESILTITLHEGRNRQVRRMCEKMGLRVTRLRRIKFGPISIRKLPLGTVRPLDKKELERLRRTVV
jgi:pseudouridine synthase